MDFPSAPQAPVERGIRGMATRSHWTTFPRPTGASAAIIIEESLTEALIAAEYRICFPSGDHPRKNIAALGAGSETRKRWVPSALMA